mmetsp:Transcript_21189/g.58389  ORF Transcript_21189/g.58389 Transcript_21189/m.58389 type:complete len:183 (-) Transcript_21189:442-990(-)
MRTRCVLTEQQVKDIYMLKATHGHKNRHAASVVLGKEYQVSSKTIRDIWNGRRWFKTTEDLWGEDDLADMACREQERQKLKGKKLRPAGAGNRVVGADGQAISERDVVPHDQIRNRDTEIGADVLSVQSYRNVGSIFEPSESAPVALRWQQNLTAASIAHQSSLVPQPNYFQHNIRKVLKGH